MTYRAFPLLTLTLLLACGPGDDATSDSTAATTAPSTGDTGTSEQTTDPTGSATDTTATGSTTTVSGSATDTGETDATSSTSSTTTDVTTTDVTTTDDSTTGDFVCPDPLPAEGTPCTAEGQSCNSGCQDPCGFCNLVTCEDGVWKGMEAFPAECADCETVCTALAAAACPEGPTDQKECVFGCQATMGSNCGLQFNQMLACIGGSPTFTCDDMGTPVVAGCEDQIETLDACLDG